LKIQRWASVAPWQSRSISEGREDVQAITWPGPNSHQQKPSLQRFSDHELQQWPKAEWTSSSLLIIRLFRTIWARAAASQHDARTKLTPDVSAGQYSVQAGCGGTHLRTSCDALGHLNARGVDQDQTCAVTVRPTRLCRVSKRPAARKQSTPNFGA
jgi:hypothetical protein